eukprot:TRINITY_DN12564_c2_g1_i1.p1 TRINITY_DN12564_c2_g1~~TRINITY_DN12564_c2_g1_i1.p1  ORF type:complete len:243 (+),score=40.19 TRINITY_DN12564_c2_g1_i1:53-781(+)
MLHSLARGTRAVALRAVVDDKKNTYPAGSAGVVWEVLPGGVIVVCLDREPCEKCLVRGRADDFDAQPPLCEGTKVRCLPMVVDLKTRQVPIPRGTEGVVQSHEAHKGYYQIEIKSRGVRVSVPAWRLQLPVARAVWERRVSAVSSISEGSDRGMSGRIPSDPVLNLRKRPTRSNLSPKAGRSPQLFPNGLQRVSFCEAAHAEEPGAMPPAPEASRYVPLPFPRLPEMPLLGRFSCIPSTNRL